MQENFDFEYWFKRAEALYRDRHIPFQDEAEMKWYIEELEKCIDSYMTVTKSLQDEKKGFSLTPVMWITYNPKADIGLKKAMQTIQTFLSKSKIKDYIYVVEQRGTTVDDIHGMHFHILHTHTYDRKSHYERETKSTFNKTCLTDKYSCFWIRGCAQDIDVKNTLGYMLGKKKDDDGLNKEAKQNVDKVYREKYKIEPYYTNDYSKWEKYFL